VRTLAAAASAVALVVGIAVVDTAAVVVDIVEAAVDCIVVVVAIVDNIVGRFERHVRAVDQRDIETS